MALENTTLVDDWIWILRTIVSWHPPMTDSCVFCFLVFVCFFFFGWNPKARAILEKLEQQFVLGWNEVWGGGPKYFRFFTWRITYSTKQSSTSVLTCKVRVQWICVCVLRLKHEDFTCSANSMNSPLSDFYPGSIKQLISLKNDQFQGSKCVHYTEGQYNCLNQIVRNCYGVETIILKYSISSSSPIYSESCCYFCCSTWY